MIHPSTIQGTATLANLASRGLGGVLRNSDGSINWRLISILGLGVGLVATFMAYRDDKKKEQYHVG